MGEESKITWCRSTFNPWLGCIEYSQGCTNCYARELVSGRMGRPGLWGPSKTTPRERTSVNYWKAPLRWNKAAAALQAEFGATAEPWRVFCGSLCDWAERHPTCDAIRPDLFALIRATPHLTWLLCTKRADELANVLPADWGCGYPNVWIIVSVENMAVADRVDALRAIPAAVRGISYEPNLGPLNDLELTGIDWVIEGAESGPDRRPYDIEWARSMRDKCRDAGVTFFRKQGSAHAPGQSPALDGVLHYYFPIPRVLSWDLAIPPGMVNAGVVASETLARLKSGG